MDPELHFAVDILDLVLTEQTARAYLSRRGNQVTIGQVNDTFQPLSTRFLSLIFLIIAMS